jgi:hypothetical protein
MTRSIWYDKNWYNKETHEFNEWWETWYGGTSLYIVDNPDEVEEYYRRKAFALAGWLARKEELY